MYGDDTPLTSESSSAEPAKLAVEDYCVRDVDAWITISKLKTNRDKTELVVLTASHRQPSPLMSISVCDEVISKSSVATILVTNLGTLPGGGHFRNFWVGMCRWDPGTLNLYQSYFS